jgi:hypothetical protein
VAVASASAPASVDTAPSPPEVPAEAEPAATTAVTETAEPEETPPRYPFHDPLPSRFLSKDAPAMRNANLSVGQCRKELVRRKLPMKRQRSGVKGIAEEYRMDGPLGGVTFLTPRAPSQYGLFDCRLGLTLDDLAKVLAEHGVVKVRIDNLYRQGARLPGRRKKSQHSYGLAIDLVAFTLGDGTLLDVETDWGSGIGRAACGEAATLDTPTERSVPLRNLACDIARVGLFHHILTPGHDAAHRNHLHLDIKRGEKTTLIE